MSKQQFDKMKVNLWVSGSIDKDTKDGGHCSLLHCCIKEQHYTKTIGGYAKGTTATRMTLQAVLNGLKQLRKDKPVFVHIYTSVVQVSTGLNKYMYSWQRAGWLTTKGEPPQHVDLWVQIYDLLTDPSRVISYKVHLQNQITDQQPHRLQAIHVSAEYLMKGKRDLYEVSLA